VAVPASRPPDARDQADKILLDAAAGGSELTDLAGLFEQIRARCARPDPDTDSDDGFAERRLRLTRHYQGHARLDADLTPPAAAALQLCWTPSTPRPVRRKPGPGSSATTMPSRKHAGS
jgi:hypothetical protein